MKAFIELEVKGDVVEKIKMLGQGIDEHPFSDQYKRRFTSECPGWYEDPECTMLYLKSQERYANDLLKRDGYLFLNDVYTMLGFPRTKVGQLVGWVVDKNGRFEERVDFGLDDKLNDSVKGRRKSFYLDFNVGGGILDYLED